MAETYRFHQLIIRDISNFSYQFQSLNLYYKITSFVIKFWFFIQKKVIYMLPAYIPFVVASLAGIIFISISPLVIVLFHILHAHGIEDYYRYTHFQHVLEGWAIGCVLTGRILITFGPN